jgi:hypothetical protein
LVGAIKLGPETRKQHFIAKSLDAAPIKMVQPANGATKKTLA